MIYFVQRESDKRIKIGYSGNFNSRELALKTEHGELKFLGWVVGDYLRESELHGQFRQCHAEKEWFNPQNVLVDWIKEHTSPVHPRDWEHFVFQSDWDRLEMEQTNNHLSHAIAHKNAGMALALNEIKDTVESLNDLEQSALGLLQAIRDSEPAEELIKMVKGLIAEVEASKSASRSAQKAIGAEVEIKLISRFRAKRRSRA